MKAQLVCDALQMAIWSRRPKAGLIDHSDLDFRYASKAFRRLLKARGIEGSMSRKGDCWDTVVESFFGSLKQERVQWRNYQSRYQAQQGILDYISLFYNGRRLHTYLGHVSPNSFERQLPEQEKAAQLECNKILDHVSRPRLGMPCANFCEGRGSGDARKALADAQFELNLT